MTQFDGSAIDAALSGAAADGSILGAVMLVADADGVLHTSTAGELPDGADTMFRIASMTKLITSIATLQLVDDGLLELGTEVASILPAFGELQVLEGFDGDTPRLRPPARQATIGNLLTHTSGCGYFFTNDDLMRWHGVTGVPHVLTGLKASLHAPLIADPGTRWEYGVSTDWAGQVVEEVRGQTLEDVFTERIAGPLGITDLTFAPSDAQRARLLDVMQRSADGSLQPSRIELPDHPEFCSGGGGAYSKPGDYVRLLRAVLRGGELDGTRILGEKAAELLFTGQLGAIELPALMKSSAPELCNDVPSLPFKQDWGCGLHLLCEDIPGMRRAGSGDWAGLMNSYYWVDRSSGVTAALFTQVLPFFDMGVVQALLATEAALYAQLGAATISA